MNKNWDIKSFLTKRVHFGLPQKEILYHLKGGWDEPNKSVPFVDDVLKKLHKSEYWPNKGDNHRINLKLKFLGLIIDNINAMVQYSSLELSSQGI